MARILADQRYRVASGVILIALSVALLAYGYLAPPRLSFEEHLAYLAADNWFNRGTYSAHLSFYFTEPLYPYQSRVAAVAIPDSPLTVEFGLQTTTRAGDWSRRQSIGVRLSAPAPGVYEFTALTVTFADGRSQRFGIGRVVVDARPTDIIPLNASGPNGIMSAIDLTQYLSRLAVCNRADSPLTLVAVDAGEFGSSRPGVTLVPGAEAPMDLALTLPTGSGRPRNIVVRPWLIVRTGGEERVATGSAFAGPEGALTEPR